MDDETFAGHRRYFWAWVSAGMLAAMGVVYAADHPVGGRNGGTVLGYAYGILAAIGIVALVGYGYRRRHAYAAGPGTLKGWLSAHVWIGVALTVVVPMHSGFKLSRNLHAVPYLLMVLTIATGIWGAFSYLRYPARMRAQREGATPRGLMEQLERASREMALMAEGKSPAFAAFAARIDTRFGPSALRIVLARPYPQVPRDVVMELLGTLPDEEYDAGLELTKVGHRKRQVANRLIDEAGMAARMRVWLYVHVPLSIACLVALAAHVLWVAYYRWPVR